MTKNANDHCSVFDEINDDPEYFVDDHVITSMLENLLREKKLDVRQFWEIRLQPTAATRWKTFVEWMKENCILPSRKSNCCSLERENPDGTDAVSSGNVQVETDSSLTCALYLRKDDICETATEYSSEQLSQNSALAKTHTMEDKRLYNGSHCCLNSADDSDRDLRVVRLLPLFISNQHQDKDDNLPPSSDNSLFRSTIFRSSYRCGRQSNRRTANFTRNDSDQNEAARPRTAPDRAGLEPSNAVDACDEFQAIGHGANKRGNACRALSSASYLNETHIGQAHCGSQEADYAKSSGCSVCERCSMQNASRWSENCEETCVASDKRSGAETMAYCGGPCAEVVYVKPGLQPDRRALVINKRRCRLRSASQQVTVTNGEISQVVARQHRNADCLTSLEKLRTFAQCCDAANETQVSSDFKRGRPTDSDCDFASREDEDLSSFTSISSVSSEHLNLWLYGSDDDNAEENYKLCPAKRNNNNAAASDASDQTSVVGRTQVGLRETVLNRLEDLDHCAFSSGEIIARKSKPKTSSSYCTSSTKPTIGKITIGESVDDKGEQNIVYLAGKRRVTSEKVTSHPSSVSNRFVLKEARDHTSCENAEPTADMTLESRSPAECRNATVGQKDEFRSIMYELKRAIDFRKVLHDLMKCKMFTDKQLKQLQNFAGKRSDAILNAIAKRVDDDWSNIELFISVMRSHHPEIADKIRHRLFSSEVGQTMNEREKIQTFTPKAARMISSTTEKLVIRSEEVQASTQEPKDSSRLIDNIPTAPSPYSRRRFTINSANDAEHMLNIQRNYMKPTENCGPYFSKASSVKAILHEQLAGLDSASTRDNLSPSPSSNTSSQKEKDYGTQKQRVLDKNLPSKEKPPLPRNSKISSGPKLSSKKDKSFKKQTSSTEKHKPDAFGDDDISTTSPETTFVRRCSSFQGSSASTRLAPTTRKKNSEEENTKSSGSASSRASSQETASGENKVGRRQRSSSFSVVLSKPSSRSHNQKQKDASGSGETVSAELKTLSEKISSRFWNLLLCPGREKSEISAPLDVFKINVDSFVGELVAQCVISVRSGWMIRRRPKHSDRLRLFFDLVGNLNDSDASDLIDCCPATTDLLLDICTLYGTKDLEKQGNRATSSNKDNCDRVTKANNQLAPKVRADDHSSARIFRQSSNEDSSVKGRRTSRDIGVNTVDEIATSTPFMNAAQLPRGHAWKNRPEESHRKEPIDVKRIELPTSTEYKKETGGERPEATSQIKREKVVQHKTFSSTQQDKKAIVEEVFSAAAIPVEQVPSESGDQSQTTCRDKASGLIKDSGIKSDSAVRQPPSKPEVVAIGYSKVQLFLKQPRLKSKATEERRLSRRGELEAKDGDGGSYVSRCLFPISTRKNSANRKSLQGGRCQKVSLACNSTTDGVECQSLSKERCKTEEATLLNNTFKNSEVLPSSENFGKEDMPPVLTVGSSKKINSKDSCVGIGVEDAELCLKSVNEKNKKESHLVTILTNGGNISPPSAKKKGVRVSFSELPPIEIELEPQDSQWNLETDVVQAFEQSNIPAASFNISSPQMCRATSDSATAQSYDEPKDVSSSTYEEDYLVRKEPSVNEVDEINELLMDILEEIEAESISLDQCLYDLVDENLLTVPLANSVSPTFGKFFRCSCLGQPYDYSDIDDDDRERAVEKLLDVLTNLGLATLSKCRNCILGRLCQLASYRDFESAQKAAVAANEARSRPEGKNDDAPNSPDLAFENNEKQNNRGVTSGRLASGEESELSATESDDDFYARRHQLRRHRCEQVHGSLTIKEVDEEHQCAVHNLKQQNLFNSFLERSANGYDVKAVLPQLIEHGAIEPRQAWLILSANDEREQLVKVKRFLSRVNNEHLETLYLLPGLAWLKDIVENAELDCVAGCIRQEERGTEPERQQSFPDVKRSTSLYETRSHSDREDALSEVKRLVNEHTSARQKLEDRMTPIAAIVKKNETGQKRSQSVRSDPEERRTVTNSPQVTSELRGSKEESELTLEEWCQVHALSSLSTTALRKNGYDKLSQLSVMTEQDMEELDGVSWVDKAKLWVAVEGLRLNEFYKKSTSGLNNILLILDT